MKKNISNKPLAVICLLVVFMSCTNEGDRTGNVEDTAMTAPPSGSAMPGQTGMDSVQGNRNNLPQQSATDTSYRIGDSAK